MNMQSSNSRWIAKITKKVQYFRGMIEHTRSENKSQLLVKTRGRLTNALKPKYDLESPVSIIDWMKQIRRQVNEAGLDLDLVIHQTERDLPNTTNTYEHAENLTNEIGKIIRKLETTITEKV